MYPTKTLLFKETIIEKQKSILIIGSCLTDGDLGSAKPCHFPFEFEGKIYYSCTKNGNTRNWCATETPFTWRWGYCSDQCPLDDRE